MKKINLRGISEILSERELKNVMGGSDIGTISSGCGATGMHQCSGSCPDVIDYYTSSGYPVYKSTSCKDSGSYCACF